jgi:hypothetical protein
MELTKKIKIALDETRMLILGAQTLLGLQFRGVFDNGYDQLPRHLRRRRGIGGHAPSWQRAGNGGNQSRWHSDSLATPTS